MPDNDPSKLELQLSEDEIIALYNYLAHNWINPKDETIVYDLTRKLRAMVEHDRRLVD